MTLMKGNKSIKALQKKMLDGIRKADIYFEFFEKESNFVAGISGGFDSLVMVDLIAHYKDKYLKNVNFFALFVDNGLKPLKNPEMVRNFVEERGFSFHIIKDTETAGNILQKKKPFNPCFICSRNRRKILLEFASSVQSHRVLLAHNLDDVIETLLLNIFYSREISTMMPIQPLFQGRYFIVRPLSLIERNLIMKYALALGISEKPEGTCTFENSNKRKLIRDYLMALYKIDPRIHTNLKHSLFNCNFDFLWCKYKNEKQQIHSV